MYDFAVLFLDLDRFQLVNDSLGPAAGDALLCEVAERVRRCVRPSDTVARLGGDELTVLAENIAGPHDATQLAARILAAVQGDGVLDAVVERGPVRQRGELVVRHVEDELRGALAHARLELGVGRPRASPARASSGKHDCTPSG